MRPFISQAAGHRALTHSNPLAVSSIEELTTEADYLMYIEKRSKHRMDISLSVQMASVA
jgi:hypothetical protein